MASEMVERLARALCVADGRDPDEQMRSAATIHMESAGSSWDDSIALGAAWQLEVPFALAALHAMREPTLAMVGKAAPHCRHSYPAADRAWRAAIDAAIAEAE